MVLPVALAGAVHPVDRYEAEKGMVTWAIACGAREARGCGDAAGWNRPDSDLET
jgi:hypothetical protein